MSGIFNGYNSESASFGGHVPIWVEMPARVESGGLLTSRNLVKGEILSAASPVEFNTTTKVAKILRIWKVKAAAVVDTDYTKVTVFSMGNLPALHAADFVMVLGSTLAATGKAVVVPAVDNSVEGETSFTVLTADIDSVTVGAFIVESSATAAGSAKSIYCTPNSLTLDDTIICDQNSVGIARGPKYLYENAAPFLPTIVKANIPMLELHNLPVVQGSGYAV